MGEDGTRIRLKWPNDVYALVNAIDDNGRPIEEKKKIGGILVTTDFVAGQVNVIIGV